MVFTAGHKLTATDLNTNFPVLIQTVTTTVSTASVTFSSIPSYSHLKLYCSTRSTAASAADVLLLRVNGDSGTHYPVQYAQAKSTSWTMGTFTTNTGVQINNAPAASATSGLFATSETLISNWSTVTNNLSVVSISSEPQSATVMEIGLYAGMYTSVVTPTSLTLLFVVGSIVAGSTISLYGIT